MADSIKKGQELLLVAAGFAVLVFFLFDIHFYKLSYFVTPGDVSQMYWNTSNFSNAVLQNKPVYYTDELLYPQGAGLLMHTYTVLFGLLNLVLSDPVLSINITIFFNLLFAALGFYYLSAFWIENKFFRFLVGFLSVFNGYMLAKSGIHYNLILIGSVPWTIIQFLKSVSFIKIKIHNYKRFLSGLGLLVLTWFFDFYAVLYVLAFLFLWFFYHWVIKKWIENFTLNKIGILILFFLSSHLISRTLFLHGMDKKGGIWDSADIRQFLSPGALGKFLHLDKLYPNSPETENFVFCGFTLFILLFIAVVYYFKRPRTDRKQGVFLFMCVGFFCVIFPDAKWNGTHTFFMPTSIVHYIPFLDNMRGPGRFIELFYITTIIFVLSQFSIIFESQKKVISAFAACVTVGFYFDYATTAKSNIPEAFFQVNQQDKDLLRQKNVLTIPFGIKDGLYGIGDFSPEDYILAVNLDLHLFSGYVSRIPSEKWSIFKKDTVLEKLIYYQKNSGVIIPASFEIELMNWIKVKKADIVRINFADMNLHNFLGFFKSLEVSGHGKLLLTDRHFAYFIPGKN